MGLNDQMASMILGELDEMTKTIEKTAAHLDSQLQKFTAMESRIESHVRALTFLKQGLSASPSQREVIQYWKDELREIHMTGRKARKDTFDALEIAVDKSISNAYARLQLQGDEIFLNAANQFKQAVANSAEEATKQSVGSLRSAAINLKKKTDLLFCYLWIVIIATAFTTSIFCNFLSSFISK